MACMSVCILINRVFKVILPACVFGPDTSDKDVLFPVYRIGLLL